MWSPTLRSDGEGRRRWVQGNGWNRPSHERSWPSGPPGYWRRHVGKRRDNATPETHAVRGRAPQPDAREGQAGPLGVTERSVVPAKPGNAGGGKGPWFKVSVKRDRHPGDWHEPITSNNGWEVTDGVAHQSEELA